MSNKPPAGRLVLNHSTHVDGLIAVLEKLVQAPGIKTVTPGVIAQAGGRSPHLKLRISVAIRGGFKVVARRGSSVQEVFIITDLDQDQLQKHLDRILAR